MPDSLTAQLVTSAWDSVNAAVSTGLALDGGKKLADLMTISTAPLPATTWRARCFETAADGLRRVRAGQLPLTFDYMYRLRLDYDALHAPDAGQLTRWAAGAREFERQHVLGQLAAAGMYREYTAACLPTAGVAGWGPPRCVTFSLAPGMLPLPEHLGDFGWDGPVRINSPSPKPPVQALLYRLGGGPYVQRAADLSLSWAPADNDGADLVLTERLQILGATVQTVLGICLVAA